MELPNFERIQASWRGATQPPTFVSATASMGVRFGMPSAPAEVNFIALRGPHFISAWLECSRIEAEFRRDTPARRSRTIFVFVSQGQAELRSGETFAVLDKGGVAALRPGAEPVKFRSTSTHNEALVFSVDTALGQMMRRADEPPIQLLTEGAINSFAFGACFGLAQAGAPKTQQAGRELQSAAGAVARTLLMQWVFPSDHDIDVYAGASRFIRVHAIEHGLTPLRVATKFGVSERKLQSAFQAHGETVIRAIRRARFEIATVLIDDDATLDLAIVAARSGFTSAKRLRAAIREFEFGSDEPQE
ncbi:hypothetical protein C5B85_12950 [Pseudoclavibacter sp. AY1F1]|uniref:helix-turn-helix domain-containing protein n=1 Tax=Pseudoclavibacter sp. AY1F1 TaxID=2080583 RepID=UPI000CE7A110|nr:helix-turn-helix domain-containing protein [Pseudoclavibacter sp. AY1F1]PPF43601.1 hypothetical protein C5B85_12950 [Pseudoclavibacter sp. AY1F1]